MLTLFIKNLEKKGYITYKKIKDLKHSQCKNCDLMVIDFDQTKDKLCEYLCTIPSKDKPNPHSSCDGLKIINEVKRIDFIEIKGFKEFLSRNHQNKVEEQIKQFNLVKKIEDSFQIILSLHNYFDKSNKTRDAISKSSRYFILLTDIERGTPESFFITQKIIEEFENMKNVSDYKKILLTENQIKGYYENLSK